MKNKLNKTKMIMENLRNTIYKEFLDEKIDIETFLILIDLLESLNVELKEIQLINNAS